MWEWRAYRPLYVGTVLFGTALLIVSMVFGEKTFKETALSVAASAGGFLAALGATGFVIDGVRGLLLSRNRRAERQATLNVLAGGIGRLARAFPASELFYVPHSEWGASLATQLESHDSRLGRCLQFQEEKFSLINRIYLEADLAPTALVQEVTNFSMADWLNEEELGEALNAVQDRVLPTLSKTLADPKTAAHVTTIDARVTAFQLAREAADRTAASKDVGDSTLNHLWNLAMGLASVQLLTTAERSGGADVDPIAAAGLPEKATKLKDSAIYALRDMSYEGAALVRALRALIAHLQREYRRDLALVSDVP